MKAESYHPAFDPNACYTQTYPSVFGVEMASMVSGLAFSYLFITSSFDFASPSAYYSDAGYQHRNNRRPGS